MDAHRGLSVAEQGPGLASFLSDNDSRRVQVAASPALAALSAAAKALK